MPFYCVKIINNDFFPLKVILFPHLNCFLINSVKVSTCSFFAKKTLINFYETRNQEDPKFEQCLFQLNRKINSIQAFSFKQCTKDQLLYVRFKKNKVSLTFKKRNFFSKFGYNKLRL